MISTLTAGLQGVAEPPVTPLPIGHKQGHSVHEVLSAKNGPDCVRDIFRVSPQE